MAFLKTMIYVFGIVLLCSTKCLLQHYCPNQGEEGPLMEDIDDWEFLDLIEAPTWANLTEESIPYYDDTYDHWFRMSHPLHYRPSHCHRFFGFKAAIAPEVSPIINPTSVPPISPGPNPVINVYPAPSPSPTTTSCWTKSATCSMIGSAMRSASLSVGSGMAAYTASAKTYSTIDMERATNNFDESRIIGEGGFWRVYGGVLEDGTQVAVKVLKRDDHQGGRIFSAELEMLSRLHHKNLVKLIGICAEERNRCLVCELIPNGSVESHLHGVDKETGPLDWDARIKIALGVARGLAYLHEDSSPRVVLWDFKSRNILLEYDFTPKVSDFSLARTAMDEDNRHISTCGMGTFGCVVPEYAMMGHVLVKGDVYSYGVIRLELLTGRKPVDMSQLPGEENLVAWARPLLTSKQGIKTITDPSLGPDVPFDSVLKVAAIASMCLQPDVSLRPSMGKVVQALK